MLGAGGGKSHILTAEELEQCQKYAKVDLLRALRERARADNNLRTFERSFYKKIKSNTGPEAFNFEVSECTPPRASACLPACVHICVRAYLRACVSVCLFFFARPVVASTCDVRVGCSLPLSRSCGESASTRQ